MAGLCLSVGVSKRTEITSDRFRRLFSFYQTLAALLMTGCAVSEVPRFGAVIQGFEPFSTAVEPRLMMLMPAFLSSAPAALPELRQKGRVRQLESRLRARRPSV
ncbi:hypothetical protein AOLI_G00316950 [Acnodon oligacanthus]